MSHSHFSMTAQWVKFQQTKEFGTLSAGQRRFFEEFFKGKNILLTGGAGTGKSFCIKTLCDFCQKSNIHIAKTASTGIAALTIGGSTIHSFAGVGLADKNANSLITDIKRNKKAIARISNAKILCIDEISMISANLMDKLDIVFKYFRFNDKPFGGVQLVLFGDLLQLPPVFKNGHLNESDGLVFESRAFQESKLSIINLSEIFRQSNPVFAEELNRIRFGESSNISNILARTGAKLPSNIIAPIKLFPINRKVDEFNALQMSKLDGESVFFYAQQFGEQRHLEALDKNCLAAKSIEIKIGAQVILLANLDTEAGWVNGTIGKVIRYENNLPVIQRSNGDSIIVDKYEWTIKEQEIDPSGNIRYKTVASRLQIPLKLGYAISIHKSQSLTMDYVDIDFEGIFECGQVYVALSRAKTLEGLTISNLDANKIKAHPQCVEFYRKLRD